MFVSQHNLLFFHHLPPMCIPFKLTFFLFMILRIFPCLSVDSVEVGLILESLCRGVLAHLSFPALTILPGMFLLL